MVNVQTITSALMAWQTFTYVSANDNFTENQLQEITDYFSSMTAFLEGGINKEDGYTIIHYEFKKKEKE